MIFAFETATWPENPSDPTQGWTVRFSGFMPKPMWKAFARRAHARKIETPDGKSHYRYEGAALWWLTEQGHDVRIDGEGMPRCQDDAELADWLETKFLPKRMGEAWRNAEKNELARAIERAPRIPLRQRSFSTAGPVAGIDIQGLVFVKYSTEQSGPSAAYLGSFLVTQELESVASRFSTEPEPTAKI